MQSPETWKGSEDMPKAKARIRAKANAAQKAAKLENGANRPDQLRRPMQFDPEASSIKSPRTNAKTKNFSGVRRGSARSR